MDRALLTRAEARAVDAALVDAGVASVLLMENAGRGAAEVIARRALACGARRAVVLVGPGNNGGDGLAVARHLAPALDVTAACVADPAALTADAAVMRDAWRAVGGRLVALAEGDDPAACLDGCDLVVDALFGTGLSRPLAGLAMRCVQAANARAPRLAVALDVPSGLDVDTGAPLGATVFRAHLTCTFAASKPGLHTGAGLGLAGEVVVVGLGAPVPAAVLAGARASLSEHAAPRARALDAHKGTAGRVLIVGGSAGRTGAALLAARGAQRAGAGLVTIASRAAASIDARVLEAMTLTLPDDALSLPPSLLDALRAADAVVVGPGLGLDEHAAACLDAVLRHARGAVVVDADALSLLHRRDASAPRAAGDLVLTPHPLELARALGLDPSTGAAEVNADRLRHARAAAERYQAIVVLKGAGTAVADVDGAVRIAPYAEPVLGVAGSGDVLAGVIAARLAEGARTATPALDAVLEGVHAHGLAGRSVREARGAVRGALASEIADAVSAALERVGP